MKRVRGNWRPNVVPAKAISIKERIIEKDKANWIKNQTRPKFSIVDICDKCNKYILIPRKFLFLRKYGWRFMHRPCYKKEFKDEEFKKLKENKIIIDYGIYKKK